MSLHLPRTDSGGVFGGESDTAPATQTTVVLDDGVPRSLTGVWATDHDARTLRRLQMVDMFAPDLDPPALALEHTAARRRERPPVTRYPQPDGTTLILTDWVYTNGGEVEVAERGAGQDTRRWTEEVRHYDGTQSETEVRTDARAVPAYDWRWQTNLGTVDTPVTRTGVAYRRATLRRWGTNPDDLFVLVDTVLMALYEDVRLDGDVAVGWRNRDDLYRTEVARVRRQEVSGEQIQYTWVDLWVPIATLERQAQARRPDDAVPVTVGGAVRYYVTRQVGDAVGLLRDTVRPDWPAAPPEPGFRFLAAGGAVTVQGPRTDAPQLLDDPQGQPNATLTAYGHTFLGGTWAALRDVPLRDDQGRVTSWDTVLVLHASAETVTAVRQDGSAATLSIEAFEREILRALPGSFLGFSPVGTFFNSWPAHWAWARCTGEARALVVHDAWRDSYKRDAPPGSPEHWTWKQRPGKRPRVRPPTAPVAPLRLTLADVAAPLLHDEPLKRGEGPLLLPTSATVQGRDVRRAVAKRVLYPPAQWPEDLDDSQNTGGPLVLTFVIPPLPTGQQQGAVLLLRLKLPPQADTLSVNGEAWPIARLGHNAQTARGWHPYVVPVPVATTYTLEFKGRCSRALLCLRRWTPGGGPPDGS
ncbi:hypothetical protein [Deinococcus gobiensis]|uniref:Uncharacterized protein n=1 Tax=Deinococcus gobiensis (strain DSM 21396 / JCM 16679 / CGMCC 1.7299 / I-0) TaxID=745776 RepID=H8GXR9_DEIGI|nr:hypothetical protein [Deinococcus gobiensis]AFD25921.1 hypothetical protein DGo_CA1994 [Deinococcus gobiensis I-0]